MDRLWHVPVVEDNVVWRLREQTERNQADPATPSAGVRLLKHMRTHTDAKTHFGRKYRYGSSTKIASSTSAEHTSDAICVRPPTSPLILDLRYTHQLMYTIAGRVRPNRVIEPYAGSVPGMKEPTRFATPSATSSRFGLIVCWKRAPFCFAATIESRKPMIATRLHPC
jgi:hypothetical protein